MYKHYHVYYTYKCTHASDRWQVTRICAFVHLYIRDCAVCLYCTVLSWCNFSSTSVLNISLNIIICPLQYFQGLLCNSIIYTIYLFYELYLHVYLLFNYILFVSLALLIAELQAVGSMRIGSKFINLYLQWYLT